MSTRAGLTPGAWSLVDRAGAPDQPAIPQFAASLLTPNSAVMNGQDIMVGVIGHVSARAVDALSVVVERAAGIGEDQHRSVAVMGRRVGVDGVDRVPLAQPVGQRC